MKAHSCTYHLLGQWLDNTNSIKKKIKLGPPTEKNCCGLDDNFDWRTDWFYESLHETRRAVCWFYCNVFYLRAPLVKPYWFVVESHNTQAFSFKFYPEFGVDTNPGKWRWGNSLWQFWQKCCYFGNYFACTQVSFFITPDFDCFDINISSHSVEGAIDPSHSLLALYSLHQQIDSWRCR